MPEITDTPVSAARLTASLAGLVHGPYCDDDTAGVAALAAEAVRYLNHAVLGDGVTDPVTVAAVTAELAAAARRLPPLLTVLGDWLQAQASAGRIGDDRRRPAAERAALIRDAASRAAGHADDLAEALSAAHNLAAALHAA